MHRSIRARAKSNNGSQELKFFTHILPPVTHKNGLRLGNLPTHTEVIAFKGVFNVVLEALLGLESIRVTQT